MGNLQIQTFRTRQLALERIENVQTSFIRPEKVYDPEDPNADAAGYVWVISVCTHPNADALHLCTDGYIR